MSRTLPARFYVNPQAVETVPLAALDNPPSTGTPPVPDDGSAP